MLFHFAQKLPARWAVVALMHGPTVDRNRRDAKRERAVENLEELLAAFGRVVDPATHLHSHRDVRRHRVAHSADDFHRHRRLTQVVPTAATPQDFLYRAAEVDVDQPPVRRVPAQPP
jgi:hypothetical protein